jgi:hypothetical protein
MAILKSTVINDSGFLGLPSGSSAERPNSPVDGYVRFNTDENKMEQYINNQWLFFPSGLEILKDGLALYLDANNITSYSGSGNTWFDLSGNNRNFSWTSTPSFSSNDTAYFSTNGRICRGPASNSFGINNTSGYTIFMAAKQNTLNTSSAFKFYSANGAANSSTGRGIFSHCTWSDNVVYFDQGGCCNSDTRTSVASGGAQVWVIWAFRRLTNSSTRNIFKNGSSLAQNTSSAANINLNATDVDISGTQEGATWDARLGKFLVYNRGLTDQEIKVVTNQIGSTYGISA